MSTTKVLLSVTIEQLDKDIDLAESDVATATQNHAETMAKAEAGAVIGMEAVRSLDLLRHAEAYLSALEAVRRTLADAQSALRSAW